MPKPRHPLVAPYCGPSFVAQQAKRAEERARAYPVPRLIQAAEVWAALAKGEPKPERPHQPARTRPAKRPKRARKQSAKVIVAAPVADIQPDENGEIFIPFGRQPSALSNIPAHLDRRAS